MLHPELVSACIELAMTTTVSRPGSLAEHKLDQMLERCRQTAMSISEPESRQALADLVDFFRANVIT